MLVTVTKCNDSKLSAEIEQAAHFFGSILLSSRLLPHIAVDITFKSKLDVLGTCVPTYNNRWYKSRRFEVLLRKYRSTKCTLLTLAHEMVHVRQFAKGQLNGSHTKWCGNHFDSSLTSYADLPWEIEASSLERILYIAYKETKNDSECQTNKSSI